MHKVLRPSTYQCNLCAITYGAFNMRKEWKSFIDSIPMETIFLHKDEFSKKYPGVKTEFPIAFIVEMEELTECISAAEMAQFNLEGLKEKVNSIIKSLK